MAVKHNTHYLLLLTYNPGRNFGLFSMAHDDVLVLMMNE
jgi:hypothetical protein